MYRTGCFVIDGISFKYEAKVFGVGSPLYFEPLPIKISPRNKHVLI